MRNINAKEHQINEEIHDKELRIVGEDGSQLGIMSATAALEMAISKDLDLVKIAPKATPPVCKFIDYGKFCFEQTKREKEQRKNQKIVETKEVYLSMKIDVHDFNTKANHAIKFLQNGDKVKVAVKFRGREMAHTELGRGILTRFEQACEEHGTVDKPPKLEGRNMAMILSPKVPK
ncbi:MAG: translation initiation factor IF-3 [Clostridia bacterium]